MEGECSSAAVGLINQKQMWSLNVPMKIKMFAWKAVHSILPTLQNLAKRRVVEVDMCGICKREVESVLHVLWSCPATSDVWAIAQFPVQKLPISFLDFSVLWFALSTTKLSVEDFQLVCFILRRIQIRQNYVVHGKAFESPQQVVMVVTSDRELYLTSLLREVQVLLIMQWTEVK